MIRLDAWRPVDGLVLEPNALKAATMLDRNVVVAAGPGAGKTELLAQRADFLLRTGNCPYPCRILAVSFKVDAARNLRDRVRGRSGPQLAARFDSLTFHALAKRIVDNFRPALSAQNRLNSDYRIHSTARVPGEQITFDDLVPLALSILESNPYAAGGIRQTFSHVFLDEFQDCTKQQYTLIKTAFGQSAQVITAVGDTKQQIMSFAGALDGVLKTFADDYFAVPLHLYQNFRSDPTLRRMQNRMVAELDEQAVVPASELVGDEGIIEERPYGTEYEEAESIAVTIEDWLKHGVAPSEIAVLVRQQPHLVAAELGRELTARGIPFRNDQESQDLAAEPAAALIFDFIRVIAADGQAAAYADLIRISRRSNASDEEAARFDSQLKRELLNARAAVRDPRFPTSEIGAWRNLVERFIEIVTRPVLVALSAGYHQGTWLQDVIEQALQAFERELAVDADPIQALRRLSDEDAIRFLTIHKCKGLEFERVVVLGVEHQLFWTKDHSEKSEKIVLSEYFVAVSRAKHHLVLTHAKHRDRPEGVPPWKWDEQRTAHRKLLNYAQEQ